MSINQKVYNKVKFRSLGTTIWLLLFLGASRIDHGVGPSAIFFGLYLFFNLKWLYGVYQIFVADTGNNFYSPKQVILANFNPIKCFYQTYFNILEILKFSNGNTFFAYLNWVIQLLTFFVAGVDLFIARNFSYIFASEVCFVLFNLYLYNIVLIKIKSLVV